MAAHIEFAITLLLLVYTNTLGCLVTSTLPSWPTLVIDILFHEGHSQLRVVHKHQTVSS